MASSTAAHSRYVNKARNPHKFINRQLRQHRQPSLCREPKLEQFIVLLFLWYGLQWFWHDRNGVSSILLFLRSGLYPYAEPLRDTRTGQPFTHHTEAIHPSAPAPDDKLTLLKRLRSGLRSSFSSLSKQASRSSMSASSSIKQL